MHLAFLRNPFYSIFSIGDFMTPTSFVLIGTIMSHDSLLSTVEFNLNPAVNGGPAVAILQNSAIPCEVKVGQKIYVVKHEHEESAVISCEVQNDESR